MRIDWASAGVGGTGRRVGWRIAPAPHSAGRQPVSARPATMTSELEVLIVLWNGAEWVWVRAECDSPRTVTVDCRVDCRPAVLAYLRTSITRMARSTLLNGGM